LLDMRFLSLDYSAILDYKICERPDLITERAI
jgi:hypothetical protein